MTSRPDRIQSRRSSSSRRPTDPSSAPCSWAWRSRGSSTISRAPMRRAWAVSLRSWASCPRGSRAGRSTTRRSIARPASREPASAKPSAGSAGRRITSQRRSTPRQTASKGSRAPVRSRYAAMEPLAWASARQRRARVVLPLEASPRMVALACRGSPPVPSTASRSGKPVETTSSPAGLSGCGLGEGSSSGSRTGASAPSLGMVREAIAASRASLRSPLPRRTAALPQRASSRARAAARSTGGGTTRDTLGPMLMARSMIEHPF